MGLGKTVQIVAFLAGAIPRYLSPRYALHLGDVSTVGVTDAPSRRNAVYLGDTAPLRAFVPRRYAAYLGDTESLSLTLWLHSSDKLGPVLILCPATIMAHLSGDGTASFVLGTFSLLHCYFVVKFRLISGGCVNSTAGTRRCAWCCCTRVARAKRSRGKSNTRKTTQIPAETSC
eukprot:276296-Rhodomonas_salina.1